MIHCYAGDEVPTIWQCFLIKVMFPSRRTLCPLDKVYTLSPRLDDFSRKYCRINDTRSWRSSIGTVTYGMWKRAYRRFRCVEYARSSSSVETSRTLSSEIHSGWGSIRNITDVCNLYQRYKHAMLFSNAFNWLMFQNWLADFVICFIEIKKKIAKLLAFIPIMLIFNGCLWFHKIERIEEGGRECLSECVPSIYFHDI